MPALQERSTPTPTRWWPTLSAFELRCCAGESACFGGGRHSGAGEAQGVVGGALCASGVVRCPAKPTLPVPWSKDMLTPLGGRRRARVSSRHFHGRVVLLVLYQQGRSVVHARGCSGAHHDDYDSERHGVVPVALHPRCRFGVRCEHRVEPRERADPLQPVSLARLGQGVCRGAQGHSRALRRVHQDGGWRGGVGARDRRDYARVGQELAALQHCRGGRHGVRCGAGELL